MTTSDPVTPERIMQFAWGYDALGKVIQGLNCLRENIAIAKESRRDG